MSKNHPRKKSHIYSWNMSYLCKKISKKSGKSWTASEKKSNFFWNRKKIRNFFFDKPGKMKNFLHICDIFFWSLWQDRYQCKIQNLLRKILKKSQIKKTPRNLNLRISKKLDSNFFPTFSLPWNFFSWQPPFWRNIYKRWRRPR